LIFQRPRDGGRYDLGADVLTFELLEGVPALGRSVDGDGSVAVCEIGACVGRFPLEVEEGDRRSDRQRADELDDGERVQPTTP